MTDPVAVECVDPAGAVLGEGPVWCADEGVLWWVDIKNPQLRRYDPRTGGTDAWTAPERIGCAVPSETPRRFLAGLKSGIAWVKPGDSGALSVEYLLVPEPARPDNRFNDGKADPRGRAWLGTMDDLERTPTGWLYRVDPDLTVTPVDGPYVVTNGPALSADGQVLYHTDTMGGTIWRFRVGDDGSLHNRTQFVRFTDPSWGHPDGSTVDSEGHLWVAHWGGSRLTRFAPDGSVERVVEVPTPQVTSCAFGGDDLGDLYITTASIGRPESERPLAGGLFRCRPGPRGVPAEQFTPAVPPPAAG